MVIWKKEKHEITMGWEKKSNFKWKENLWFLKILYTYHIRIILNNFYNKSTFTK